jgi:hypothetical protein
MKSELNFDLGLQVAGRIKTAVESTTNVVGAFQLKSKNSGLS